MKNNFSSVEITHILLINNNKYKYIQLLKSLSKINIDITSGNFINNENFSFMFLFLTKDV